MIDGLLNQESALLNRLSEINEMIEQIELSGDNSIEVDELELEKEEIADQLEYVQSAIDEIHELQSYGREYNG